MLTIGLIVLFVGLILAIIGLFRSTTKLERELDKAERKVNGFEDFIVACSDAMEGVSLSIFPSSVFKYIGEEILSGDVLMGGEESGGLWVNGYIPERDGILMSLMLLEILCRENKTVNEILKEIYNSYGFFLYKRCDYEIEADKKQGLKASLENKIPDILKSEGASQPVKIDGFKYFFEDKSWIMIRPSGTEAVVRIYAESDTSKKLDYLHELGRKLIETC